VLLDDYGIGRHYVVDDVNVHDVTGCDCGDSGGVVFSAGGSSVPTGFAGIQVTNSTVSDVNGHGIATASTWNRTPLNPGGQNTFVPISGVLISHNVLTNQGGDGIVVMNGVDPVVEWNVVDGFALRETTAHAGLWAFNSDNPVMQFNYVSHGAASPIPAPAYDVDGGNSGVVYQYNFSYDNGGGFMFLCAVPGLTSDGATMRYNISDDDQPVQIGPILFGSGVGNCPGSTESNLNFYNNVIYSASSPALVNISGQTQITFENNIFAGPQGGATITAPAAGFSHNLYFNISSVPPQDANPVTGNPGFNNPGAGGLAGVFGYLLRCGSPAIGTGAVLPGNGGRDFYGFPVPVAAPPNIGAYQGPCLPASDPGPQWPGRAGRGPLVSAGTGLTTLPAAVLALARI
jgi:hypothetical protein